MLSEFDLIHTFFTKAQTPDARVALGIGDDCALLQTTPGKQLAISTDMLVSGRHFFPDVDPRSLGHKALAVNLSDLAAMGARPLGFSLALALPEANPTWLAEFSSGLFDLANQYQCTLIGGDTTKGPLNICITVYGEIEPGKALRRDAAQVGDDLWISGTLGDARLALAGYWKEHALSEAQHQQAAQRMHRPSPRVELGCALAGIAHAALDISDGLIGDLGHILKRSHVGARIMVDELPAGPVLAQQSLALRREFCLAGGDDYELCFTAAAHDREKILEIAQSCNTPVTRIGAIEAETGLRLYDNENQMLSLQLASFDHFKST